MTPSDTVKQPFKVRLEWAWKEQAKFRAEYALLQDKLRILKDILDSLAHTKKSNTRYWMEFNEEEGRLKLDQDQVTKTQKALTEVHKGLIDAPYQISSLSVNTKYSLKLFDEQGPALRNHWKFSTAELAAMNICDTSFLFVIQSHEPESENVSEPLLVEAIQEANDTPRTTNRAPGSGGELGSGSNNSSPGRPQHNGAQPGWLPIGTLPNYPHRVFRSKSASTIESMKLNELLRIQQYSKYRQEHFNIALQVILCHLYLMDVFSEAGWPSSASNYTLYSPPQARAEYKSSALKCIFVNCGFGNVEMGTYQSSTAIFETGGAASATSDSRVMRLALLIYGIVHWEDREGDTPFNTEPNDSQSLADLKRTLRKLVHGKATARNPKPFYFGDVFSEFLTWDSQSSLTETQLLIKFAQIISRFGNLYLASEG